jgi:hypothetical protein
MLFSLLIGIDFFVNSLNKGGRNHHGAAHILGIIIIPRSLQKGVTFEFLYKHRYPQIWGWGSNITDSEVVIRGRKIKALDLPNAG